MEVLNPACGPLGYYNNAFIIAKRKCKNGNVYVYVNVYEITHIVLVPQCYKLVGDRAVCMWQLHV